MPLPSLDDTNNAAHKTLILNRIAIFRVRILVTLKMTILLILNTLQDAQKKITKSLGEFYGGQFFRKMIHSFLNLVNSPSARLASAMQIVTELCLTDTCKFF